nr:hypothetical protein [Maliibacterium massiliense]
MEEITYSEQATPKKLSAGKGILLALGAVAGMVAVILLCGLLNALYPNTLWTYLALVVAVLGVYYLYKTRATRFIYTITQGALYIEMMGVFRPKCVLRTQLGRLRSIAPAKAEDAGVKMGVWKGRQAYTLGVLTPEGKLEQVLFSPSEQLYGLLARAVAENASNEGAYEGAQP